MDAPVRGWLAMALSVLAMTTVSCSRRSPHASSPPTDTTGTSATTTSTVPVAMQFDAATFAARYSHAPDDDAAMLTNNGFTGGLAKPVRAAVTVFTLQFQGRDGASETQETWSAAAAQRTEARRFPVPGVTGAQGVSWYEATTDSTVQQVLFSKGTTLFVVEARVRAHSADTSDSVAIARDADAATG